MVEIVNATIGSKTVEYAAWFAPIRLTKLKYAVKPKIKTSIP